MPNGLFFYGESTNVERGGKPAAKDCLFTSFVEKVQKITSVFFRGKVGGWFGPLGR